MQLSFHFYLCSSYEPALLHKTQAKCHHWDRWLTHYFDFCKLQKTWSNFSYRWRLTSAACCRNANNNDFKCVQMIILYCAFELTWIKKSSRELLTVRTQSLFLKNLMSSQIWYVDYSIDYSFTYTEQSLWSFELQQVLVLSFIKLSVISLYRRIFNIEATWMMNWDIIAMISIISAWVVAFFFSFLFICGKDSANYWISAKIEKSFCVTTQKLYLASVVSNVILNILVIFMTVSMMQQNLTHTWLRDLTDWNRSDIFTSQQVANLW